MNLGNLLVLANSFPDSTDTFYSGMFIKEQLKALSKYFNQVFVISPVPKSFGLTLKDKVCKNYEINNKIKVFFPRFFHIPISYFRKKLGYTFFKVVDKVIQENNLSFDFVYAHFTWPPGFAGSILKDKYNVPLIIQAHGYDIYGLPFTNQFWYERVRNTLNTANYVITVSHKNAEYIKRLKIATPFEVIPNGFDKNLFKTLPKEDCRKKLGLPLDKKVIVTVGNLVKQKGHKYLFEAISEIVKRRKDILCVVIGDGPEKKNLLKQISLYKIQNFIKLVGRKKHTELPVWLNAADLFVMPSLVEGNPTVIFEALGTGLPVVGTRVGGIPEIIRSDEYGLIVEPANSEDLVQKITFAIDSQWNRKKIVNFAQQFSWNVIAEKIYKIFEKSYNQAKCN